MKVQLLYDLLVDDGLELAGKEGVGVGSLEGGEQGQQGKGRAM